MALSSGAYGFGGVSVVVLFDVKHNHLYDARDLAGFNCSHVIHRLCFGSCGSVEKNTLDSYSKNMNESIVVGLW